MTAPCPCTAAEFCSEARRLRDACVAALAAAFQSQSVEVWEEHKRLHTAWLRHRSAALDALEAARIEAETIRRAAASGMPVTAHVTEAGTVFVMGGLGDEGGAQ